MPERWLPLGNGEMMPGVNVYEEKDEVVVKMDLPWIEKDVTDSELIFNAFDGARAGEDNGRNRTITMRRIKDP